MKKRILIGLIPIIGLMLLLTLSGCVEEKPMELQEVNVGLSWVHEAQYAGMYWADQRGLYEDKGLKVNFTPYRYEDLAQELVDGTYDFVLLQTETLLMAREAGLPVKAIFADYRLMPTVYFSKKENNITKPQDLVNKTVGVAYSERYPLVAMLKGEGINLSEVDIVDREYDYGWLANDTYDVEAGWVTDGLLVTEAVGEYNVIRPYEHGVNWYADLIATTEDMINNNPDIVENFLRATSQGWQNAIENVDEAALLTKQYGAPYSDEHLKFVLEVSVPLIHTGEYYIGWMEKSVFENTITMFFDQGVLTTQVKADDVYTTEFLEKIYEK
ncbi:MAG: ABC transporter substrate-binding protein [Petrotogales bacterium]